MCCVGHSFRNGAHTNSEDAARCSPGSGPKYLGIAEVWCRNSVEFGMAKLGPDSVKCWPEVSRIPSTNIQARNSYVLDLLLGRMSLRK